MYLNSLMEALVVLLYVLHGMRDFSSILTIPAPLYQLDAWLSKWLPLPDATALRDLFLPFCKRKQRSCVL
jgi:hypothetical protein